MTFTVNFPFFMDAPFRGAESTVYGNGYVKSGSPPAIRVGGLKTPPDVGRDSVAEVNSVPAYLLCQLSGLVPM